MEGVGEQIGKDWYNLAVRGFAVGVNKPSLRERWSAFDQTLLALEPESRQKALWAFCRGMGLDKKTGKELDRHIASVGNRLNIDYTRSLIVRLSQGKKPIGARAVVCLDAIIDLTEDPQATFQSLHDYLTEPARYDEFFSGENFILLEVLLPALNSWYEDRKDGLLSPTP